MAIPDRLAIGSEELSHYHTGSTLGERARGLVLQQRASWDLAARGYSALEKVEVRSFEIDGYPFTVQYNPGRITSSSASVDDASIRSRRCFLCGEHLPEGQRAILIEDGWLLLVNPFPIFPEHFTIARTAHVPQRISGNVSAMLGTIRSLGPDYTLFYNGPRSGASAPDHLHFQVGTRDFLPIDHEASLLLARSGEELGKTGPVGVVAVSGVLRPFFALESREEQSLTETTELLLSVLPRSEASPEEPMVNIIARWEEFWRLLIYPRIRHRPSFFFDEGPGQILISPAAVDMGGVSVVPRREDFEELSQRDLEQMFSEVCPDAEAFSTTVRAVRQRLASA